MTGSRKKDKKKNEACRGGGKKGGAGVALLGLCLVNRENQNKGVKRKAAGMGGDVGNAKWGLQEDVGKYEEGNSGEKGWGNV